MASGIFGTVGLVLPTVPLTFCRKASTLAKTEMIYPKNVRAKEAVGFTQNKYLALRTIEKMKILGAVLELPAKQHC